MTAKYGFKEDGTPIDPGEGWRLVAPTENINDGDEYLDNQWQWRKSSLEGGYKIKVSSVLAGNAEIQCYRRRTDKIKPTQPQDSGWQRVSETCLPYAGKPIWLCRKSDGVVKCEEAGLLNTTMLLNLYTHWRYCEGNYQVPPPPQSEAEEAFEKWRTETNWMSGKNSTQFLFDAFNAGRDYERSKQ